MTRQECEDAVKGPGKFEGEQAYVPYYWNVYLEGFALETADDDGVVTFDVHPDDIALFPELKGQVYVYLTETNDGFVCEVSR